MALPVLASDAEREACAARLRDAATEGRLEIAELDERLDAAYRARTQLDLARLVADLPSPPAVRTRTPGLRWAAPAARRLVAFGAAANVTLLGLWMADVGPMRDPVIFGITDFALPWPLIPLAACAGAIAAAAWRAQPGSERNRSSFKAAATESR
jgi:Domain of unknown function (DUF1707)